MTPSIHESLKAAYEDVAYVGRPNPYSLPDRLAEIATLFGLSPPDPATARVLEVGCGDGANILPMATRMPGARFVATDYSALLMGRAREMADALRVGNVDLVEGDLREVARSLGTFDYIIGHGFYSWVPDDVRDAFVALARGRLAPGGLVYVSYNVLPGCYLRRIAWDAIRLETAGATTARERIDGARRIRRDLAEAWSAAGGMAAHLAREFADDDERPDSSLYHDDASGVNFPVYFSAFVRHAGSHGLGFLAEAELGTMGAGGLPPAMQSLLVAADPLSREQYLDFARLRRFRQSILAPAETIARARLTAAAIPGLHFAAVTGVVQEVAARDARAIEDAVASVLVDRYPATMTGAELAAALVERGTPASDAPGRILRSCFSGAVELHTVPLGIATRVSERPRAYAVARWQAGRSAVVTNLRHEGVRLDEPDARAVLAAADGSRDRGALAAVVGSRPDATAIVDHFLDRFAYTGLLEA